MTDLLALLVRLVLLLPWLLFIPGLLTQLWFAARRPLPDGGDWLDTVLVSMLFSLCLTGWLCLVLVELGRFELAWVLLSVGLYCGVLGWLTRRQEATRVRAAWRGLWTTGDRWTWLTLLVVLISAVLYFHPHEYVLGGADAGVYVNLGAHISRTGGLVFEDPELATIDPRFFPVLFRSQPSPYIPKYIQFPGFYLVDEPPGTIIPQFYPLHPTWLAVFHSLGGVRLALYVTPLWGALGVLAVGLLARKLFGGRAGALAAAWLAISATQIWFARYPTSEVLTQLLLVGGIYAFVRYVKAKSSFMGLLAGSAIGQVMLVRLDSFFLLAIPILWIAYLRLTRQLEGRSLLFPVIVLAFGFHGLVHGVLQSWPYLHNSYFYELSRLPEAGLGLVLAVALLGYIAVDGWVKGRADRLLRLSRWVGWMASILAVLVVVAALYGYFVRPRQADLAAEIPYWYADQNIPYVEPLNLVRLGWYLSPLGILLAVLGFFWMLRHELSTSTALFLGVGLFFAVLYLHQSRNNPQQIYVMRRYVPAVIPAFAVAAAYAIERWGRRPDRWRWLAWGAAFAQTVLLLYGARSVLPQVDYRGVLAQLGPWAEALDPEAVILFDDDVPISTGATVGTSLRYLYDRTAFDVQEAYLTEELWADLVQRWQAQDRRILLAVGPEGVRDPFTNWPLRSLPGLWLETQVLESSYTHFPRKVQQVRLGLELYELQALESVEGHPLRVDIGSSDSLFLGTGWHEKERLPDGTTVRWTSGVAQLHLPLVMVGGENPRLRVHLSASADAGKTVTEVRLHYCGEVSCGFEETASLTAPWLVRTDFGTYEAVVPESQAPLTDVWIETDAWRPVDVGVSGDARELGVMVDWVEVASDG